jgi:hypothetical protein
MNKRPRTLWKICVREGVTRVREVLRWKVENPLENLRRRTRDEVCAREGEVGTNFCIAKSDVRAREADLVRSEK